jgi:phosphoserine phosphatase RsbU/P
MKLRWKFFFVLLAFSLAPLGVVALVGHRETIGMSHAIATDVNQTLTQSAGSVLKLTAESSARILDRTRVAVEFALAGLAHEAEVFLAEEAPGSTRVYFASDFDNPATAPPDFAPRTGSGGPAASGEWVSIEYPAVFLAPGVSAESVADEIDRLSLLADAFLNMTEKLGRSLHWVYVGTESGVQVSFPGHGSYPADYDPRERPWFRNAVDDATHWSAPYVDAITGLLTMTASRSVRNPDGTRAGVAAVDVLLSEALRVEALSAWWTAAARSLIVRPVYDPATRTTDIQVVAQQKDVRIPAGAWEGPEMAERLAIDDPVRMQELVEQMAAGRSGLLEMPYQGTPSIWAFARASGDTWFLIVVPRTVIERVPERTLQIVKRHTRERGWATAGAAVVAVILAAVAALLGSRGFTRPIVDLVNAAGRLSRGDYTVQVLSRTGDERDQLIQSFNEMVPRLEDQLRMHESLQLATEVQQNLLPKVMPAIPGVDVAALSIYCDETGGDYYDFITDPNDPSGSATIVVADVSGHGAHAALLMASARAGLRLRASLPGSAADIVADVNRLFAEDVGDTGAFMTMFYLTVDGPGKSIRWVRAGHDPAVLFDPRSGRFEELGGRGAPLGIDPEMFFQERVRTDLHPGVIIFIGTDGIWESMAPDGKLFGKAALYDLIRVNSRRSAKEIVHAVVAALESHRQGLKPADDITMAAIKLV